MRPSGFYLKKSWVLVIREATPDDARAVLDYVEIVSGESGFLTFGPGEFEYQEIEEKDVLQNYRATDNQLYLLDLIDGEIVSILVFSAGHRRRLRHVCTETVLGPGDRLHDA